MEKITSKVLKKILDNGTVALDYHEITPWYDLSDTEYSSEDYFQVSLESENEEYWLEITNGDDIIADEIITSDDCGVLADWLFNRGEYQQNIY